MIAYFIIKDTLATSEIEYYKNVMDGAGSQILTNIRVCNKTASVAKIYISVSLADGDFASGAIVYGADIAANGTLDVPDRAINVNHIVRAYSDTANALVFSADVEGNYGEYEVPI